LANYVFSASKAQQSIHMAQRFMALAIKVNEDQHLQRPI
jgi:hypothetical protein